MRISTSRNSNTMKLEMFTFSNKRRTSQKRKKRKLTCLRRDRRFWTSSTGARNKILEEQGNKLKIMRTLVPTKWLQHRIYSYFLRWGNKKVSRPSKNSQSYPTKGRKLLKWSRPVLLIMLTMQYSRKGFSFRDILSNRLYIKSGSATRRNRTTDQRQSPKLKIVCSVNISILHIDSPIDLPLSPLGLDNLALKFVQSRTVAGREKRREGRRSGRRIRGSWA